ncbi:hypothetical protein B0T14DRAFT_521958 [Immersiella caudata]|uniref:Uncharacterized protein n=1 Tax=Immersiella caudata TaxID=314043 RepID=A0AA40C0Y8_9PEZI|nr:hypothetical protein B0T14DRAFT_521958 [Immersiella caudata]
MGTKSLLRRVRDAFRRRKEAGVDKGKGVVVSDPQPLQVGAKLPIIHPGMELRGHLNGGVPTISRADMQRSASDQDTSALFSKLPLELRRQIYGEVWRSYLGSSRASASAPEPDLRLHIYTDGSGRGIFRHTQCQIHPGLPSQDDAQVIEPWPFHTNTHTPPTWFWFAWVMRLHWDKHWKCQHQVMKRWDPQTGNAKDAEPSPFLALFLTCKKMYWESISSLFETVTPVFTSSEDAHRFFIQRPHPFLSSIRTLEFSFTNPNDHLFLAQVQRGPIEEPVPVVTNPHACMVMPYRLEIFGQTLWGELVRGLRGAIPDLKDFDVTIGGRFSHEVALARFGWRPEAGVEGVGEGGSEEGQEDDERVEPWTLPGRLAVLFKADEQRYVQEGVKMVRR